MYSDFVSVLALVFSIISFYKIYKIEKKRRNEEIGAFLTMESIGKAGEVIRVSNKSRGTACNVKLFLDNQLLDQHSAVVFEEKIPSTIGGMSHVDILLSLTLDMPGSPLLWKACWDDDVKKGNWNGGGL